MTSKQYLGDGVYITIDDFGEVVLTTENGGPEPTNIIILEPSVIRNLINWLQTNTSV